MEEQKLSTQVYDNGRRTNNENHNNEIHHQDDYPYLSSFPPGYRFEPYDHELIDLYLVPKINGDVLPANLMHEINIYKHNPDHLTETYRSQGQNIWYFFTSRDRKYRNGRRPNRKAGDGYWKATGADKVIKYEGKEIGFRKALVFYKGKPPRGSKTPWIMHEFRVSGPPQVNMRKRANDNEDTSMRLDDYVLCRIYKKEEGSRNQPRPQKQEVETELEEDLEEDPLQEDVPIEHDETDSSSANSTLPIKTIVLPEIASINTTIIKTNFDANVNMINYAIKDESVLKPTSHSFPTKANHPMQSFTSVGDSNNAGYLNYLSCETYPSLMYSMTEQPLMHSLSEHNPFYNDVLPMDTNRHFLTWPEIKHKVHEDIDHSYGLMMMNGRVDQDYSFQLPTKIEDNVTKFFQ